MSYSPQGRGARGKVGEPEVRRIRQLAGQGQSTRSLADAYDLTPEAVRRIVRWDTWRWVSEEGPGFVQPAALPAEIAAAQERLLAELTGQLDPNGIPLGIPPAIGGTSTDGEDSK